LDATSHRHALATLYNGVVIGNNFSSTRRLNAVLCWGILALLTNGQPVAHETVARTDPDGPLVGPGLGIDRASKR